MATIYLIKSKTSGKCYVGQTNHTALERWSVHLDTMKRIAGCVALYSAIRKYGESDFEITEVVSGKFDKKQLNELEKKYISDLKTLSPNGYNLQTGGNSFNLAQEVKDKISKALKGRKVTWGDKVSSSIKKLWADPEYRARMVKAHMGKQTGPHKIKLSAYATEIKKQHNKGVSISELSRKYNVRWKTIWRVITR